MDFRLKLRFVLWFLKISMGKQIFVQDEKSLFLWKYWHFQNIDLLEFQGNKWIKRVVGDNNIHKR